MSLFTSSRGGGGVTCHIGTRECVYEGSNPDPKIWVPSKTVFRILVHDANLLPKNMDVKLCETRIPSTLAQNVLCKLRNDSKPNWCPFVKGLEQQNARKN